MCRLNSFTEEWKEDIIIFKVNVFNVCVTSVYLLEQKRQAVNVHIKCIYSSRDK